MEGEMLAFIEIVDTLAEYGSWIIENNDKASPAAANDKGWPLTDGLGIPHSSPPGDRGGRNRAVSPKEGDHD